MRVGRVAKLVVAALGAGVVALQAALTDDVVTGTEWLTIGVAAATALGVWAVPNAPQPARPE